MDRKSKYLILFLTLAIIGSIGVAYWRYVINSDYEVIVPEDPSEFILETE